MEGIKGGLRQRSHCSPLNPTGGGDGEELLENVMFT